MPRKKIKKSVPTKRKPIYSRKARLEEAKWTESYSSFLLGVVAVIVLVLFGISLLRQQSHQKQQTTSLSTGPTPTAAMHSPTPGKTMQENGNTYYIVKSNDSLWNIAQTIYQNGYKWTDIATTNHLANPSLIFTGDKLLIPHAPVPSELGQMMQSNEITNTTYTVVKGDDLWHIALRAYGDGYQWVKIARANNLANPDLIFSGNILTIPR